MNEAHSVTLPYRATLPASWYHDPAIFARERQAIFASNWCVLAREEQLREPGDYVAGAVANWPIIVLRDRNGELRAFHNVCRHRASPVVEEGDGHCDLLRCPYHGWAYALDGTLQHSPGFADGDGFDSSTMGLHRVRVEIWNTLVFVCLNEQAPDLPTWLGDIVGIARDYPAIADLNFERGLVNEGDVNWKSYSDNSAEGYHLGSIHRELSGSLVRDQTHIAAYENGRFVGFDVVYKEGRSKGFWIYKFPGLLLHFSARSFNLERVIPLSATRTRMERWFWFEPNASPDVREETIGFSNRVMNEDFGICERVQRNLEGGMYNTGMLSSEREPGTIYFQQLVREALQ